MTFSHRISQSSSPTLCHAHSFEYLPSSSDRRRRLGDVMRRLAILSAASICVAIGCVSLTGSDDRVGALAMFGAMGAALIFQARFSQRRLQAAALSLKLANEAGELVRLQLQKMASRDPVTGFPNRTCFHNGLESLLAQRGGDHGHAAVLVGPDNFKLINSALGHVAGNTLLRLFGERLKAALPPNTLIARMDGDEFGVLLNRVGANDGFSADRVANIARELRANLCDPFHIEGQEVTITVSIGLTLLPAVSDTPELVLQRATLALNAAKEAGGDITKSFHTGIRSDVERRHSMEVQLRGALERGEFELWLQPKVDMAGRVAGAESLLRWKRRGERYISPVEFIPVAEATGMIHSIGDWVLEESLKTLATWQREGVDFKGRLAVNISPWQLRRKRFDKFLDGLILAHGLRPEALILEITESALLDWSDDLLGVLCRLRASGVEISLDDFGTGFSSLSYLQRLPLDELKIDRAFVSGISRGVATPLLSSIVEIARSHGLRSVAEGVETREQHEALMALGCDLYQGFYFGRPVPVASFVQLLGKRVPASVEAGVEQLSQERY
jgi:diguanylate cyclase (GGDEF)-like protein